MVDAVVDHVIEGADHVCSAAGDDDVGHQLVRDRKAERARREKDE